MAPSPLAPIHDQIGLLDSVLNTRTGFRHLTRYVERDGYSGRRSMLLVRGETACSNITG
jgi:hypothetical protein